MQFLATIVQGPHHSLFGAYTIPPFRFQPRNRSMDWRRMSVLDVDRVTREVDVATLQENLTDITFCTLDPEDCGDCLQPSEQALLNALRLAQLTIEYLMHGQDFLMTRVTLLELHLQTSLSLQSQSQQELDCQAEELRALLEERRQQQEMIKDLQQLLRWSGGQSYYMCHLCEEMFRSASNLQSHLRHRHEGTAQGEKRKQDESMEEVVRDLRAQLTSTQQELTALLKKQRQLQEAKTTRQRERDVKAMFKEREEELSEEIEEQKQVFWDEPKSSVRPNSPLEEKPGAPQSCHATCSNLGSLQDAECEELLRMTQEYEDQRLLRDTKIQLQYENQELRRKNKMLQRENKMLQRQKKMLQEEKEKMQKENEKLRKENEKLKEEIEKLHKENEKLQELNEKLQEEREKAQENERLQKVNERLHDMLCQLHVTASQSQQHIVSLITQMQQQTRLITSQEMTEPLLRAEFPAGCNLLCSTSWQTQTSSHRKVKGSARKLKAVNMDEDSSKEESEDSGDEQHKVLEAQEQNISLRKMFGQTLGNDQQERQESKGRKRDAKEVPKRTFTHVMKQKEEKKKGRFSEWCSKTSDPSLAAFSSEEPRSLKVGPMRRRCSTD